jgi:hypothetical protein
MKEEVYLTEKLGYVNLSTRIRQYHTTSFSCPGYGLRRYVARARCNYDVGDLLQLSLKLRNLLGNMSFCGILEPEWRGIGVSQP